MSGGGRSSAPATQTQVTEPPAFLKPQLEFGVGQARELFESGQLGQQFFPGSTVVGFSPEQEQALQLATQRATGGSPLVGAAQGQLQSTIEGGGFNPFISEAIRAAQAPTVESFREAVLPGIQGTFAQAGRSRSGLLASAEDRASRALGRTLSEQAAGIALPAFEAERQRQLQATQLAPTLAREDIRDIELLQGVGQQRESLEAARLQEEINRFQFGQAEPGAELARFLQLIQSGSPGPGFGTRVGTSAPARAGGGGFGGALSGAASGAQFGTAIGGPGFGTALGALFGGAAGGFF